ncbi:hypothetical protein EMCRGX_G005255 [Ephydatia muelleri]
MKVPSKQGRLDAALLTMVSWVITNKEPDDIGNLLYQQSSRIKDGVNCHHYITSSKHCCVVMPKGYMNQ